MKKWKKLKCERVFDHKYFKVNKDLVRLPNGEEINWFYWNSNDSVMVVGETSGNELIMIRQYRYLPDCEVIEFPSGKVEDKEDIVGGALREFNEETGYECKTLIKLGEFYETYGQLNRKIHIFYGPRAKKTQNKITNNDEFEDIKVEIVDFKKALDLAIENKIIAMGSALAVLLLKEFKLKNARTTRG